MKTGLLNDCREPGFTGTDPAGVHVSTISGPPLPTVEPRQSLRQRISFKTADAAVGKRHLVPHRDDGKRFVVRADEKLTAFVELEISNQRPLLIQGKMMKGKTNENNN
jgi:hypothetical protein